MCSRFVYDFFFFFNDTATTEIYTLSLHDALPIQVLDLLEKRAAGEEIEVPERPATAPQVVDLRSEEHTSELQSHSDLVCRLLLEKKNRARTRRGPGGDRRERARADR